MARVPAPIEPIKLPKDDLARLVRDTANSYTEYSEQLLLVTRYRAEAAKWAKLADEAEAAAAVAWAATQTKAKTMADEIAAAEQPVVLPEDPTAPEATP